MTCCENTKLSLKLILLLKRPINSNEKNAHSTVLQNAWSQKNKYSHWKTKLGTKKTMVFIEKRSWMTKNLGRHWKSIRGPPKNSKSPLKTQWHVAKTQSSLWKLISLVKRRINSNEKTPTAPSYKIYKMPEAKKNQYSHWKTKLVTKKPTIFFQNDLGWQKTWGAIENQLGALQKIQKVLWKRNDMLQKHKALFENSFRFSKGL